VILKRYAGHRLALPILLALSGTWLPISGAEAVPEPMAILPAPPEPPPPMDAVAANNDRILGVIPNYQTVNDSSVPVAPMTARQKWALALKETLDPFNVANAAFGASFSQAGNQTPKYGVGSRAYTKRFAAAMGDLGTQTFFSTAVLASVLHQDPRYYRRGPQSGVVKRIGYSLSRLAVTRQDSGRTAFNASALGGMALGIVASNVYYPAASVRGAVMLERISTSLTGGVTGNLLSEFWPDIQQKFFHKRH